MSNPEQKDQNEQVWVFPSLSGGDAVELSPSQVNAPTAADLERLQKQAKDEATKQGYQEGLAKGVKAGESQIAQKSKQWDTLIRSLAQPYAEQDEQIEQEIVALAIQIARQLIRRELKIDSTHVIGVVREALGALPSSSQNIQVLLHPEDVVLVKESLAVPENDNPGWQIIADPTVSRGGCKVVTSASSIDATIEHRLASLIAQGLGDERAGSDD